jgi:hypothetical protein
VFLWVWPGLKLAVRCFGPPAPWDARLAYAQGFSIAILGFVLSPVSTAIIRTFICTEFDDGVIVLSAEMTLSCDPMVDPARSLWVAYAALMLVLFPICAPLTMLWALNKYKGTIMKVMRSKMKSRNALSGKRESRHAKLEVTMRGESQRGIQTTPLFFAIKPMFEKFEGDKWWYVSLFASLFFATVKMSSPVFHFAWKQGTACSPSTFACAKPRS